MATPIVTDPIVNFNDQPTNQPQPNQIQVSGPTRFQDFSQRAYSSSFVFSLLSTSWGKDAFLSEQLKGACHE